MKTTLKTMLALVACLIVFGSGQVRAGTEVPAEWLGIWQIEITVYDCDTNDVIFQLAELDTVCPGTIFEDPDGGEFDLTCTSAADANSLTMHCEGESEFFPGCTANFVQDTAGTRNGETYTVTSTTAISYVGDCFGIEDSCQRTETTGARIAGVPGSCESTPNRDETWGSLKSSYR